MVPITITLGFKLFLIAACLFAPVDKPQFKIEYYENKKKILTLYVERTNKGYFLYSDKDTKKKPMFIAKNGNTFTIGDGEKASSIDNSKVKLIPFMKNGSYKRIIGKAEVLFEYKDSIRKIYQKASAKYFIVR